MAFAYNSKDNILCQKKFSARLVWAENLAICEYSHTSKSSYLPQKPYPFCKQSSGSLKHSAVFLTSEKEVSLELIYLEKKVIFIKGGRNVKY